MEKPASRGYCPCCEQDTLWTANSNAGRGGSFGHWLADLGGSSAAAYQVARYDAFCDGGYAPDINLSPRFGITTRARGSPPWRAICRWPARSRGSEVSHGCLTTLSDLLRSPALN